MSPSPTVPKVRIKVAGKELEARVGETILHALWAVGRGLDIQTGCAGGVCGACTVTVRFADGRPGGTDLACLRPVEEGMEVFPFPVDTVPTQPPVDRPDVDQLRQAYPTLDRCTKCTSCTIACPMSIPVMDSVLRMQRGEFEQVAEDFTTCIHCGLCRAVCEDKVRPHHMGIWVRRSLGMAHEHPGSGEKDDALWGALLSDNPEERLQRAREIRGSGRIA